MTYYAIARGRKTGIFSSWDEARKLIYKYQGAKYKKFERREDAENFLGEHMIDSNVIPREDDTSIIVFTDGACIHNGKLYAKGAYSCVFPYNDSYTGAWPLTLHPATNNKAEYMGLIRACEIADIIDPSRIKRLDVYTDSMLLIQSATKWLPTWKCTGYKKSDGSNVLNVDLLQSIDDFMQKRQIRLYHVRAHTGKNDWFSTYNDVADMMAKSAICTQDRGHS